MKKKFINTCCFIMILCVGINFLYEDSAIAGIAFVLGFFTQVALAIGLIVEEE
ncbi:hypothetical protein LCL96_18165 [Rossellomorea aquimaris]|uniref:hypothetical protein n=1 Tax=Rossellomorea aquimaris TaxID=189382 RepID=UPI001CD216EC|nr:hypothetical protein [Rossellomorea aquimaris]MCA1060843.1 hypothetical protein [Rossellomorea aquimaris]